MHLTRLPGSTPVRVISDALVVRRPLAPAAAERISAIERQPWSSLACFHD